MLSRRIGEIDWAAGDTTSSGMKGGVWVGGLKHVPVGQDVKMLGEEGIIRVAENVPWMRSGNFGEEV